tara:strand:- start:295 stop:585 length:291 start_codon:yes stop_codon:yes gene_type:complete
MEVNAMSNTIYYLRAYIEVMRSAKVDGKLFADLEEQRAYFRKKSLEVIPFELLNGSEVARQAGMTRTRLQDIQRGKTKATADDLASILHVLDRHFG